MSEIAVVGMACRFPHAPDVPGLWRVVRDGVVTFQDIPADRWNHASFYEPNDLRAVDKTYIGKGAFLDDVKQFGALHFGLAPRRVQVMDPQQRILIEAVRVAMQDAGYDRRELDRGRTGVFVGASVSEYKDLMLTRLRAQQFADGSFGEAAPGINELTARMVEDVTPLRAFSMAGGLLNMAPASVSQVFDLGGPSFTIDAACSSALVAVHEGVVQLRSRQCNVAIAGGVYLNLTPDNLVGFARIGAISRQGLCRPFDANADGFVMGEGVGVVILKRLEDARRDGDRVYAVIKGSGCNNDGHGEGPMTPRAEGQVEAMERAHADCDFPVETIGYVETHGTATTVGDVVEVGALKTFFARKQKQQQTAPYCYLSSVKANIGHTMSAAGIAGFIKTCLVLHHKTIVPQPSVTQLNPKLELHTSPFRIASQPVAWEAAAAHPRRAAVSSFGFGGTNAHLLLEEAPDAARRSSALAVLANAGATGQRVQAQSVSAHGNARQSSSFAVNAEPELFLLSAATPALLGQYAERIQTVLQGDPSLRLADVAQALATRKLLEARAAIVARTHDELLTALGALKDGAPGLTGPTQLTPQLFAAPSPAQSLPLAFLLPGQGAQRVGLLLGLFDRSPRFAQKLQRLDAAAVRETGVSILGALYPKAGVDAAKAANHLKQTQVCQPALAALSLALGELLSEMGVVPSVLLGHSLGEFGAAALAGMISSEDAVGLVAARGAAMASLGLKDAGAMVAVMSDRAGVTPHLQGLEGVVVANENHPRQVVLSGTSADVAHARARLEKAGVKVTPLEVSHAFHSPLMEAIRPAMTKRISALTLTAPQKTVVSCVSGKPYGSVTQAKEIWLGHATAPVDFQSGLRSCEQQGAKVYLQLGAGSTLLAFARGTVDKEQARFLASASNENDGCEQLLSTLGQLAVLGVSVDLLPLFEGTDRIAATLPATPIETQAYWAVEKIARPNRAPLAVPQAAHSSAVSPSRGATPAMDSLVALFREQMAVLQAHADIIRKQNETLGGDGFALTNGSPQSNGVHPGALTAAQLNRGAHSSNGSHSGSAHASAHGGAQSSGSTLGTLKNPLANLVGKGPNAATNGAPGSNDAATNGVSGAHGASTNGATASASAAPAPAKVNGADVEEKVLASVARISAFPQSTLRLDQTLVDELGFDSLMLVELDGDIGKAWPSIGGLPRGLFARETRISDITAHLARALEQELEPGAAASSSAATQITAAQKLKMYQVQPVELPLHAHSESLLVLHGNVLVVRDELGVAEKLLPLLEDAGVEARLGDGDEDASYDGVIDLGLLTPSSNDVRTPVRRTLRLARKLTQDPSCFVSVTRLGGKLGFDAGAEVKLGQTSVFGFVKALAKELPEALVKAIDVDASVAPAALAEQIFEELRSGDRRVEVGYTSKARFGVALGNVVSSKPLLLGPESVVVITGGAKGIGAKLAKAFARKYRCQISLWGRSAAEVEVETLQAQLRAEGAAKTSYQTVDVRDAAAVKTAVAAVKAQHGRLDGVIHSAGLIQDRLVSEKEQAELDAVFETKAWGALNLLEAVGDAPLALFSVVSSWAGRFGNAAQTDYAAANELTNRLVSQLARTRPGTKAVAVLYPPWEDSAMAQRIPSFKKAELKAQGVPFLSDDEGVKAFMSAVESHAGEVLVAGELPERTEEHRAIFPVSRLTHVYLNDHQMAGHPVLPLASALDHVAAVATEAVPERASAFTVKDFRLQRGVLVHDTTWLEVSARHDVKAGNAGEIAVEISSSAAAETTRAVNYRGNVLPVRDAKTLAAPAQHEANGALPMSLEDFYASYTFHGPKLQGITSIEAVSKSGITGWVKASRPAEWIKDPARAKWTVDPLIIDASFQLGGYWAWITHQRAGFPLGFTEYTQLAPFGEGPIRCTVTLEQAEGDLFRGTLTYQSKDGQLLAVMTGAEAEFKQRDPQFRARDA
ncbi:MAG: type I polyketide synthase, partial [Myxococcaceae bacterium]